MAFSDDRIARYVPHSHCDYAGAQSIVPEIGKNIYALCVPCHVRLPAWVALIIASTSYVTPSMPCFFAAPTIAGQWCGAMDSLKLMAFAELYRIFVALEKAAIDPKELMISGIVFIGILTELNFAGQEKRYNMHLDNRRYNMHL